MVLQIGPHRAYVGNIPFKTTSDDIKTRFSEFGNLTIIDLKQGFCFVEFDTEEAVLKAISETNNTDFMGYLLKVERARPPKDHSLADEGCFTCGSKSHFARECPEKASRKRSNESSDIRRRDNRDRSTSRRSRSRSRTPPRRSSRYRSSSRSPTRRRRSRDDSRDRRSEHSKYDDRSRSERRHQYSPERRDTRVDSIVNTTTTGYEYYPPMYPPLNYPSTAVPPPYMPPVQYPLPIPEPRGGGYEYPVSSTQTNFSYGVPPFTTTSIPPSYPTASYYYPNNGYVPIPSFPPTIEEQSLPGSTGAFQRYSAVPLGKSPDSAPAATTSTFDPRSPITTSVPSSNSYSKFYTLIPPSNSTAPNSNS